MEEFDGIRVRGARQHNLKNVDVDIPRNQITVVTGLSGSGKSSLAFDTVYAEGQRRYVESLSAYARNFLEQLQKPDVDSIHGLSPAISIEQKTTSTSPRSTVGTVTEVFDYLRLLFAKVGTPVCPTHRTPLVSQTPQQIMKDIQKLSPGTKFNVLSPIVRAKKGEFLGEFQKWLKKGFVRARIDGKMVELENATKLAKTKVHNIELVIDRLVMKPGIESRIMESLNSALQMSDGYVVIENLDTKEEKSYSMHQTCSVCGYSFPELEPRLFSFNNPKGYCPDCLGLGVVGIDEEETESEDDDSGMANDEMALEECGSCKGFRLKPDALNVLIHGKHIGEFSEMKLTKLLHLFETLDWSKYESAISSKILKQIRERCHYLVDLGVGYLSLARSARTLSGGESQRIRLASQLGSSLVGVLYVLDEPSIGLHARDHHRLLQKIRELCDLGNTIVMVEHDEETIRSADLVFDIGPRAGRLGGEIKSKGTPQQVANDPGSITGQYLSGKKDVLGGIQERLTHRRTPSEFLTVKGAAGNNLQKVNVQIPLGMLVSVTGVSGSGKSTLIIDTLYRTLHNHFYKTDYAVAPHQSIVGMDLIDSVVNIDQRPIGRTPRSNPATYVGLFGMIRDLFSQLPESRMRGYGPGRFSFNVKGGRCENCQGGGDIKVEMHFMADVFVQCDVCQGSRYNRETLTVKYRDKSIAEILQMTVEEATDFFQHHKIIGRKVETLKQVGLDYIHLGQSSTTLSGGEAQRVKLSKELSKRGSAKCLYILDEPTTGLHFEDIRKLVELLHQLVDQGHSVIVIEHNLDVVRASDYVIDLGPEGGDGGGRVVAQGTPEQIISSNASATGAFLKKLMAVKIATARD